MEVNLECRLYTRAVVSPKDYKLKKDPRLGSEKVVMDGVLGLRLCEETEKSLWDLFRENK